MSLALLIELIVAFLLVVTIAYCFTLDRRLAALRNGQDGLREVISGLNMATSQAQASVVQLKATGEGVAEQLQSSIDKAQRLADELSVMVEAGDGVADRLAGARAQKTAPAPPAAPSVSKPQDAAPPAPLKERDIANVLGGVR